MGMIGPLPPNWKANEYGGYTFSVPGQPKPVAPTAQAEGVRLAPVRSYGSVGQQIQSDDPYDIVGEYQSGNTRYMGQPRWKADLERERAELELEQLRWMIDQMRRNPNGASIRDLIYGKGGK